jgi:hypothetical protein
MSARSWTIETGSSYPGWRTYPQEFVATAVSVCQKRPAMSSSWPRSTSKTAVPSRRHDRPAGDSRLLREALDEQIHRF